MSESGIRPLRAADVVECERILRALPEWFGIESAIVRYVKLLPILETLVFAGEGAVTGFLAIRQHNPASAEIEVMAVDPSLHGAGTGGALVRQAESVLSGRGVRFLEVKTLGPSRPHPGYERTRGFYEHLGFSPLEENRLWGDENPCLILVKALAPPGKP